MTTLHICSRGEKRVTTFTQRAYVSVNEAVEEGQVEAGYGQSNGNAI